MAQSLVLFFIGLVISSHAKCFKNVSDSSSSTPTTYTNELIVTRDIVLRWKKNLTSKDISFQIVNKAFGFVAIGFSIFPLMIDSDSIIIEPGIANKRCPIRQVSIKGKSKTLITNVNRSDSSLISTKNQFENNNNGWIASFSRLISPSMTGQISLNEAKYLLVAWSSSSDVLVKHTDTRIYALNLIEGTALNYFSSQQLMQIAHGVLMVSAWAVIIPIGIAVARYGKFSSFRGHPRDELSTAKWLLWHRRIQYVAWFGFLIGFLTIVSSKPHDQLHFQSTHGIVGLLLVTFGILQPLTSFCRGRIHRIPGYVCVTLALGNVFLGLIDLNIGSTLFRRCYEAYLSIVITIYVLLELRLNLQRQLQRHGPREPI